MLTSTPWAPCLSAAARAQPSVPWRTELVGAAGRCLQLQRCSPHCCGALHHQSRLIFPLAVCVSPRFTWETKGNQVFFLITFLHHKNSPSDWKFTHLERMCGYWTIPCLLFMICFKLSFSHYFLLWRSLIQFPLTCVLSPPHSCKK